MSIELKEKELVGGKRKRELIAVYIPKEKKVALETWAASEERSVSWIKYSALLLLIFVVILVDSWGYLG